ncbi:MAG: VOC family protein [Pseudomonadales bacterium]
MNIKRIHHVAYRCQNAKQTVAFYQRVLDMDFLLAIAEDKVPSTQEPDPYIHVFMDAGSGNVLAFFEIPNSPPMQKDPNTPSWVQHIALELDDLSMLMEAKAKVEQEGLQVIGPVDHTLFQSIYFFDPNDHRLELTVNTAKPGMLERLKTVAPAMIEEWDQTKKAPQHATWLHEGLFK